MASPPHVDSATTLSSESPRNSDVPKLEKSATVGEAQVPSDPPDGGLRAWLVVLGVSCGICATFGFVNAWGTFQAYYETVKLPHRSPSDIAWIGSIQYAMVFMPGLAFGRLFDMGYLRLPIFIASALLVVCTFLTAECKEYWQFLLCQGFGIGLASGVTFTTTAATIPHWFKKRLGLALACIASGSSIGGTIVPIIIKNLLEHVSFQWTLRIMGFICLGFVTVLNLTVARRLPPKPHPGPFINLSIFKHTAYAVYVSSLFAGFLGLYTCLTYITVSAIQGGLDANFSFYLLAIANAASTIGRIGGGILADRIGPLNVLIPGTLTAAVLTYGWPFAKNKGGFAAIAVIYGISSGVFVGIMPQPIVRMGKVTDVGMRVGMACTIMSFGAIAGPPISGAIVENTGSFKNVGYYAGTLVVVSAFLMLLTRQLVLGQPMKLAGHV